MSKINTPLVEENERKLPETNAELYDCDFVFEAIGIPKPIVEFNLSEASFIYSLLMGCIFDMQKTLSSGCRNEAILRDAQSMHEEASKLMHRIRDAQKELEDYIYPCKITDYI